MPNINIEAETKAFRIRVIHELEAEVERLRTAIEDALSIAVMEGRPMHMEPWASLEAALVLKPR